MLAARSPLQTLVRVCSALVLIAVSLALTVVLPADKADAAVIRPFTTVFSQQTNGSIQITGNTVMTCGTGTTCVQTQNGTASGSNNNFTMVALDVDSDPTTSRSSSADLSIPAGGRVLYAGLFWGGARTAGTGGTAATGTADQIKLRTPGSAGYTTLTADRIDNQTTGNLDYSAYRNVTAQVQAAGAGTYWGADIVGATGTDRYAAWSLVVAVEDPSAPLRDLTVFNGYATVTNNDVIDTTISGFLAPPSGAVGAKFGGVTYEGDQGLTGDYFQVGTTRLADNLSASANFFASRITAGGTNLTNRNPAAVNNLGLDAKVVDAPGVVPNGATSANVRFATSGDFYYPAALTTQIDLYAPTIQGSKTITNLSGNNPTKVGDVVEYSMTFSNTGDDAATNAVITDAVPANVTFVPGSIRVTAGANQGTKTDAAGDDQGEYDAASRTVRVRVGTGATATAGGRLAPSATTTVAFRATVNPGAAGTTLVNSASLAYRAETIGRDYGYNTAAVSTPVADQADVSITKTAAPDPVTAGNQVTYALTVRNDGPNPAAGVQVVDTLPAGVTYVSSNPSAGSCSISGQTLTCDVGTVAANATATIGVVVRIPPGSDATSVTNVARVTTTTSDPNGANNTASATSTIIRQADLALTKTASPTNPVPGNDVTYTLTATNNGASRADDVTVTDTLPSSLAVRTATAGQGSCTVTGSQVSCSAGALDPGQSVTVTVVATVPSNAGTAALTNSARVTSTTPDPTPGNNAASATVTPAAPRADLAVTKVPVTSPIVAGRGVQYVVTVTNNGPSDAASVTLTDPVPASLSGVTATSGAGTCTVTGQQVSCPVGGLAAGSSVQVRIDGQLAAGATGTLSNTATVSSPTADPTPGNNSATSNATITTSADLAITKTAAPVADGDVATYSIVVTNNGPSVARSVSVSDPVPAPLTYVSSTSSQGSCSVAGGTVTCAVGDLPAGGSATVTVRAQTPPNGSARGVANTATVSSPTADPTPGNNSATFVLPTTSQADLAITKTVSPSPVVAGQTATWVLTARNNGPSNATGVTITDVLPARVTGVSATSPGGSCAATAGNNVSCTAATLASGATFVVTVTGTVQAGSAPGPLTNAAQVSATTPADPSQDNNSASATTEVVSRADVSVTKGGPATATAGATADWTLRVRNDGPSTATGIVLTDNLPAGVTFVSSTSAPSGTACTAADGQVTCPVGTLAPGAEVLVTVRGRIGSGVPAGTTLRNTSGVTSVTADPAPGNNTSAHSLDVVEASDVRISKAADPATLVPGAESTYVLTVTNAGPSDARGVVVTDTLDADLTVLEATIEGGACTVSGQTVTCTPAVVPVGATVEARIRVLVDADRQAPVVNTASVTSPSDTTPGNNSGSVSSDVQPSADMTIVKSASSGSISAGEGVAYTLTAVNNGPSRATGVTVSDTLPAGITPVSATASTGTCTVTGQQVTCPVGGVEPGAPVTITIVASTSPSATTGPRTNTATVTSDADPVAGNNSSDATVTIGAEADVRVTKSPSTETFVPGRQVGWSIVVNNAGPSTARGIVVTDTVPEGVTVLSAVHGQNTPCAVAGRTVTCDLGDRVPGQRVITITGTLASGYAGSTLTNTARATTASTDPAPGNNEGTATAGIVRQTDLEIVKTVSPANPVAGQRITYTLSAYNNGPSDALNPQFIDQLPSGLTDVVVNRPRLQGQPATAECELRQPVNPGTSDNPNAPTVFCNGPVFRAGLPERVIGSIEATVAPGFTGDLSNTARISSDTIDLVASNNESTVTSTVAAGADVSLTKTISPTTPVPGQPVTWTLTARNDGPSTARNVVVRDDVADGITGLTAGTGTTPNPCAVAAGNDVTCTLGDLAPGATVTITLTGGVPPGWTGPLDNTATISSPTDTTPGNNTATVTSTPVASADVSVTKTVSPTTPVAGQPVTWTVTARNDGPSTARDVVVRDDVADAITGLTASTGTTPNPCAVAAGNDVTCTLGDLAPGATVTITLTGGVPAGYTGGLDNTATISSPTDSTPGNNTATATSTPVARADVSITKTVNPTRPVPGAQVSYTIVVANSGPSVARDVTVSDPVPTALTGVTVTSDRTPEPCTLGGGNQVSCDLGDLPATGPGSTVTITVTGTLPAGFTGDLVNTATVASPTDTTPGNNSATASGSTAPQADVTITKSLSPAAPVPGRDVTYTLVITNNGPSVARGVTVRDDVADALTGLRASTGATPNPCTVVAGNDVTCALGDLPASGPGSSVVVTITGALPADYTGTINNTATVDSITDSTPGNNSATANGTAVPQADVSIAKSLSPNPPVPGQPVTYTIVVTNNGPSLARTVTVRDDVDDALTGLTASNGCTVAAGNDVTCGLGDLAPGSSTTLTLTGGLPAGFTGTLANTATVSSPTDTTPGNNSASANATADARANVSITKVLTPSAPVPGREVRWTVVVSNAGPSTARDVVVRDDVDDAITGLTAGTGATPDPCTIAAGNDVTCSLGDLAPGSTTTVTLTGSLPAGFTGTVANTATVASPTDTTPGNNSATVTGTAAPTANVGISKTVQPSNPVPGQGVTWTVVVGNTGPSTARDVVVRDDVNDAITGLTASTGATPDPCTIAAGNDVTCSLGDLAPGDQVVITLTGDVPADYTGQLSNTATVSSPTDDTPANNTATANPTTSPGADLSIIKTASPAVPVPGQDITWTVSVTNAGPSVARDVVITDDVNDALTGVTTTGGCTVAAGNVVTCELGDIGVVGADATRTVTITGRVPADYTGDLGNTATVTSPTDTDTSDNSSSTDGTAEPTADVSITKTATPADPVPGTDTTWTVTVTNAGPSVATGVVVRDDVADALTGLTTSSDRTPETCTVAAGNDVTCQVGTLAVGETVTITITGRVPSGFTGDLDNTATVSSPDDDTPGNNTASTSGTATPQADVSITKVATPTDPVPGRAATWTLTVANAGPSVARDVVVTDDVLDAITGLTATAPCTIAAGNVVTCELGQLDPGETRTLTLRGDLPAGYTGAVDNTATVSSPTDSTPGNNTATTEGDADPQADVSITKVATPNDPVPGQDVTWTIAVANAGPSVATDVVVSDDVLDAITGLTASAPCTIAAGNLVTCDLGSVAPGTTRTVTVTGRVPAGYTGAIDNTATVASPTDTTGGNNSATTQGDADPQADVSITKVATPTDPVPGQDVAWTIRVTNAGPSVARAVTVSDDVPDVITGVTASAAGLPADACTVTAGNQVDCALGDLDPGTTVTITVRGGVPASYTGRVDNTATVASPTDTTTGNNTATATGTAAPQADVSITKAMTPARPVAGEDVTFTMVVTNAGPSGARDVVVTDELITALGGATATMTDGGTCRVDGQVVACTIASLASGARATVTVTATVADDFTGVVTNTGTVASSTKDPDLGNNTATVTETGPGSCAPAGGKVTVCPALGIDKTASPRVADPGDKVTYTVTVTNAGPSAARDVEVVDELDEDLTLLSATVVTGQADVRSTKRSVTAVFGVVRPGAEGVIRIVTRLADDASGTVPNTAVASVEAPDVGDAQVEDEADVQVRGDDATDGGGDPGDNGSDAGGSDDGGPLPDTGLPAGVVPLAALSVLLLALGLWLVRRSRVSGRAD